MAQLTQQLDATHRLPIRMEVLRETAALAELRTDWLGLFDNAHNASAPLHPDWIASWWEQYGHVYGQGCEPLRLLCFRRGGQLVGVLPLYQRRPLRMGDGGERLCFIGTGEHEHEEVCPDYLDLLSLPDATASCTELAWSVLCGALGQSYDRLTLANMSDESALVTWARKHAGQHNLEVVPCGACPIANLSGGLDAYLMRLSANTRQQARRLMRGAAKVGVAFEIAQSTDEAMMFLGEMIALHQHRWRSAGEPGCFASERFTQFHTSLVRLWHPQGRVILSRLRLGAEVISVKYGFRVGAKYDFYQSGIRLEQGSPIKSPGIVSFLLLMDYLSSQGVELFDFLRGSSNYKQRLATSAQPLVEVRRVLWTWRTAVGVAADLGGRAVSKLGRTIVRRRGKMPVPELQEA